MHLVAILKPFLKAVFLFLVFLLLPGGSYAAPFFFPDMNPAFKKSDPPEWLKTGNGNDGYLMITSEVIPVNSCTQMSTYSFWGSDKTQLVLSVVTNGFKNKLDKVEIPIATFDGREGGSQCASLSTTPTQIVPMTNLSAYSVFNPGHLSLILNVRSSNDSNKDFIGSAKLLLGTAAILATGGSAAAIGGVTTAVGTSVASDTQVKANGLLQGMVDAKIPVSFSWAELRKGIDAVEVFVYKSDQDLSSISDKQISQLQKDPKADKQLLFTVKLEFQFFRSLFYPAMSDIDGLASRENLSRQYILNYVVPGSNQNFMQLLNNSSPSLLQKIAKADGADLAAACSVGFERLKLAGLDYVDSAIVMKSFVDEAKGDDIWYENSAIAKSCFGQAPAIAAYLERIYGKPPSLEKEPQS
jgi:hypothetical protein